MLDPVIKFNGDLIRERLKRESDIRKREIIKMRKNPFDKTWEEKEIEMDKSKWEKAVNNK